MKMNKTKNILFITSSTLATNPRLVKNYIYFSSKGHTCRIIAFKYGNWTDDLSQEIIEKHNIECILIPASRERMIPWIKAVLVDKVSKMMRLIIPSNYWTSVASSKRVFQLLAVIKKLEFPVDYIEGHTLAALYPSAYLSKKLNVPFSFDVEDYHPGEIIIDAGIQEKNRRIQILKNHLPAASFVTAASPLIALEVESLLEWKTGRVISINNSFFSDEFIDSPNVSPSKLVKYVWFSQKITFGRGLELFIEAVSSSNKHIELTLIGSLDHDFYNQWIKPNQYFIKILVPISQEVLHKSLFKYDVGLIIELSSEDVNKDICLANKLFAYLQSGLFLFATNTRGHVEFLRDYPDAGLINDQNKNDFMLGIESISQSIDEIRNNKNRRFKNSAMLSYEEEVKKIELAMSKI